MGLPPPVAQGAIALALLNHVVIKIIALVGRVVSPFITMRLVEFNLIAARGPSRRPGPWARGRPAAGREEPCAPRPGLPPPLATLSIKADIRRPLPLNK